MTFATQNNYIFFSESRCFVSRPWFNMMNMKALVSIFAASTPLAGVAIFFKDAAKEIPTISPRIHFLSLWRTAIFVSGVSIPSATVHSVSLAPKPWFGHACLFAKNLSRFFTVSLPVKRIFIAVSSSVIQVPHIVVRAFQIKPTRTCGYFKITQLLVNIFRITFNYFCNIVSRKTLDNVFFIKPVSVKVL